MALVAIVGGEALGIALGKLFELVLVNIVGGDVQMDFTVSVPATAMTAILYLGIFALFVPALAGDGLPDERRGPAAQRILRRKSRRRRTGHSALPALGSSARHIILL